MAIDVADGAWIAIQVQVGTEKSVRDRLILRGYEQFLPLCRQPRREQSDKWQERALFSGYLFCRYVRNPAYRIVEVPNVVRLVGIGKTPLPVPNEEIEDIRRIVDSGFYTEPWKFIQVGDSVVINRGPLCGIRGVLACYEKKLKLVVNVELLGRGVAVEIEAQDVMPLNSATAIERFRKSQAARRDQWTKNLPA